MRFERVHVFEGNIAELAVVGRFFSLYFWLLLDVDYRDWRGLGRGLFLWLGVFGRVDETSVSRDVAAVGGCVGAAAAAVDALPPHCGAGGRHLAVVLFQHARDVALLLKLRMKGLFGRLKRLIGGEWKL